MSLPGRVRGNVMVAVRMGPRFLLHHLRRWQKDPFEVPVRGFGRLMLRPRTSDVAVAVQIFAERQYDLERFVQFEAVRARIEEMAVRGVRPLILDLGANIGASSIWFAELFPTARIVAVEPDAGNAAICRANAEHRDIEVVEAAVGSARGEVTLRGEHGQEWGVTTVRTDHADHGVPVVTVADLVAMQGDGFELLLVKIDIEGFEADLFAADTEWVDQSTVICVEPHDWMLPSRRSSRTFQRVLGTADFDLLILGENLIYVRTDAPPSKPTPADAGTSASSGERPPSLVGSNGSSPAPPSDPRASGESRERQRTGMV